MTLARTGFALFVAALLFGSGAAIGYNSGRHRAISDERDRCAAVADNANAYVQCVEQTEAP